MQRKTVLLLFGGESSEHEVSVSSARNVYAAIDEDKFDVILGYIDHIGRWWLLDTFESEINTTDAVQLLPVLGARGFATLPHGRTVAPQVILPILHGKNGEDGAVQALAELLHIPIVGCDMASSALCMDKLATKRIVGGSGIAIVEYEVHKAHEPLPNFSRLSTALGSPLFVKPANAGSSVGVSKVQSDDELEVALKLAHRYDAVVLIERGLTAHELEVGVLGNVPTHQASGVGEVKPDGEFYSYESKYSSTSGSDVIIPADIADDLAESVRRQALEIYALLGCRGLARVDFFLDESNRLYFNEINTIPGFTNISMYPKLWRERGLAYPDLIEKLIGLALEPAIVEL